MRPKKVVWRDLSRTLVGLGLSAALWLEGPRSLPSFHEPSFSLGLSSVSLLRLSVRLPTHAVSVVPTMLYQSTFH